MNRRSRFTFPVTSLAGSRVANIFSYLRQHRIQPKYYPKFILSIAVAGILEIFGLWEVKRYGKRIRDFKMKTSPVFIIGFWRSGTTLLHHLMCQDETAGYTTTLQAVFPHVVLSQKRWLSKFLNYMLPEARPFDQMSMDMNFPQEEEYGLTNIHTHSLYKFFLFPADFDSIVKEIFDLTPNDPVIIEKWKKEYTAFIAKSMINTGGTRYIGKNPCNLFRIELIKEIYPDARFIFIHRSPYQVVESLYRFFLSVFPGIQLQDIPPDYNREKIVLLYKRILDNYFKNKTHLYPADLIEIKMDDFVENTISHLEKIYERFNMRGFKRARPRFENYLNKHPSSGRHFYPIDPETIRLVNLHAPDIVVKLGYKLRQVPETAEFTATM